jgi:membrane-associated protease RseP (regulator of RpoE activity)
VEFEVSEDLRTLDDKQEYQDAAARLERVVRRVMDVDEIRVGEDERGYAVRFAGHVRGDSEAAFDELEPLFRQENLTLMFRPEKGKHVIMGLPGVIEPTPSNPLVNLVLLLVTLVTVLMVGALYGFEGTASSAGDLYSYAVTHLGEGVPYALSLMAILLAHEFGHYLAARYHKSPVTLPYFLPFPLLGSFGTLGAFIRLKAPPKNRRVLLDVGLAGPLAGLVIAIPLLLIGLAHSEVGRLPINPLQGNAMEGNSLLYLGAKYLVTGRLLPEPLTYHQLAPLEYWVRYFFTGRPFPAGGTDILLGPVAWAGWVGLLVTALNLIPAGQLDGGHLIYVLSRKTARALWSVIVVLLILLGIVWTGWFLWAFLIFFLGRAHAQPLDTITPLDGRRKALAILGIVIFFLVFTPVPLTVFGLG